MTDDEFIEMIWFYLMDVDLTGVRYVAVEFDGEIVFGTDVILTKRNNETGKILWRGGKYRLSGEYLPFIDDKLPDNHKTVLITL